jgi:uncharacterized protein (DUF433 family)
MRNFNRRKKCQMTTTSVPGFPRITRNPKIMVGKPCIRSMRVTMSMVLGNLNAGTTIDELLASYPYIEREDVMESLQYEVSHSLTEH